MSKPQWFSCGDGTEVSLNSMQLLALLQVPCSLLPFPTYWALRHRGLIRGLQHNTPTTLTLKGRHVVDEYRKQRDGHQT